MGYRLDFFASIVLLLLDMMCGVAVCHRRNWARWYYLICQLIIMIYLLMASLNWLEPDIFRIEGDSGAEILHSLLLQKIPDVVIIGLLFSPGTAISPVKNECLTP